MSLIPPTPSRFAVLPDDDPTDFTPKPDKNAKKKAKKAAAANEANNKSGKPAKAKARSSNDGDLKAAAFGTKSKGSKNKKNNRNSSEKKDEEAFQEWKEKDKKVCVFLVILRGELAATQHGRFLTPNFGSIFYYKKF